MASNTPESSKSNILERLQKHIDERYTTANEAPAGGSSTSCNTNSNNENENIECERTVQVQVDEDEDSDQEIIELE